MDKKSSSSKDLFDRPGRILFFIGAGFTKAIANSAPTGNDFLERAFEPQWTFAQTHRDRMSELKEFIEIAYHPLGESVPFPRIEDVLSLFDFCIGGGGPLNLRYDVESLKKLRDSVIFLISRMIQESIEGPQQGSRLQLSRRFVEEIRAYPDVTIISTNYDIILDNALLSIAASCNYGFTLRSNVSPRPQGRPEFWRDDWDFHDSLNPEKRGLINQGAIRLLKLHGSLNWIYCPRCDEVDITIGRKGTSALLDDKTTSICVNPFCTAQYEPLLVTPTMLKIYSTRALRELWIHCEQAVSSADTLIFIGYSLPDADYLIRTMLIRGLAKNPRRGELKVTVIDRERKTAEEKMGLEQDNRYESLLGKKVHIEPIGLEGLLNNFNRILQQ